MKNITKKDYYEDYYKKNIMEIIIKKDYYEDYYKERLL